MSKANQTRYSFGEKWKMSVGYQVDGLDSFDSDTLNWIITRNGFASLETFEQYMQQFSSILDAGCGNGRILSLLSDLVKEKTTLYGLDFAAADIARANLGQRVNAIYDSDLTDKMTLAQVKPVEFIYCQEVLHHTSNPELAFRNLVDLLLSNGEIAIYVYKQKAPVREFSDDFVRKFIESFDSSEAMMHAAQFTQLGRVLSELDVEFDIPAVSSLEIPAGRYTIQRFIYHFFAKCYWNPELSVENNKMINYDWYHPSLCSRHTLNEVLAWFEAAGLRVIHSYVDEYGITVRGTKP